MTLLGAFVRPRRETVWAGGLVALLAEFGFSSGAARVGLTRLVQRDLLSRQRDGRLVHYRLTARANDLLAEGDERIFSLGHAGERPERWTVLWHTIPEERRMQHVRLTRRLRFLGFGSVRDGTWMSPHDRVTEVDRLVAAVGVREHVVVLVGTPAAGFDFLQFARRAWDLDHLDARYDSFARRFSPYLSARVRSRLSDRDAFVLRTRLVHEFRVFPNLDPELPDEYMPERRHRARAVAAFETLYPALLEPAQRYFDLKTSPGIGSRRPPRGLSADARTAAHRNTTT